jgi:hypothetical protein
MAQAKDDSANDSVKNSSQSASKLANAKNKPRAPRSGDALVIGAGLGGLVTAYALAKAGRSVTLCEAQHTTGGYSRPVDSPIGMLEHGLKFFPDTDAVRAAIVWLGELLEINISIERVDAPAVAYDDGKFKPYVGFGDQDISSIDDVARHAVGSYLRVSPGPAAWVKLLRQRLEIISHTDSQAQLELSESELAEASDAESSDDSDDVSDESSIARVNGEARGASTAQLAGDFSAKLSDSNSSNASSAARAASDAGKKFKIHFLPLSTVTKLVLVENTVTEVLINGLKTIPINDIYHCAASQDLLKLLPETAITGKLRARILKGSFRTSVQMDILHSGIISESQAVHVFKGANEEPCLGLFSKGRSLGGKPVQHSQWVTFVDRDKSDETEITAGALKQIQRQLKRAYPSALEGKIWERIIVQPLSHGDLSGGLLAESGQVAKISNLFLISGSAFPDMLSAGILEQLRQTFESYQPAAAAKSENSEMLEATNMTNETKAPDDIKLFKTEPPSTEAML